MSAFDLYPDEVAAKMERGHAVDLNAGAGFLEGALTAPLKGAAKGLVVEPGRVLNLGLSAIPAAVDQAFGTSSRDWWFENMMLERASRKVTPNPRETGVAGQILHSLFDVGGQALTVGPAGTGVIKTVGKSIEGVEEGLDTLTAMKKGAIEGGATALGVALPIAISPVVGSRIPALVQQLGYGVASNVPMGVAQRALTSDVLSKAGYKDMAEQYKALDEGGLLTDFVLGMAFGGLGHVLHGKDIKAGEVKPSDIDAALAKRNAYHLEVDTAPGLARNGETRDAHVESVLKATEDLMEGRPVDVSETLHATDFETHGQVDKARADIQAQTEKVAEPIARAADETARLDEAAATKAREPEVDPFLAPDMLAKPAEPLTIEHPEIRSMLQHMADNESGWAEMGGRMIRTPVPNRGLAGGGVSETITRTQWIPKSDWWKDRPGGLNEEKTREAVRKALEGEKLKAGEQRMVGYLLGVANERISEKHAVGDAEWAAIGEDVKVDGLEPTHQNITDADLVAKASEKDEAALEAAAVKFENDDAAFMAEVRRIINEGQKPNEGAARSGQADQGTQAEGARPAGDQAGAGQERGQAPRGQPGEASKTGEATRHIDDAEVRDAEALAAEHPDLLVTLEDGTTVSAAEALAKADEVIAQAQIDAKGFEAAVMCATRRGG